MHEEMHYLKTIKLSIRLYAKLSHSKQHHKHMPFFSTGTVTQCYLAFK